MRKNSNIKKNSEVTEKIPYILGGSSTDTNNKIIVDRARHFELVRYWNKVIRDMLKNTKK